MPGQFVPVTSDPDGEGYFTEDRESVYCKHGTYVGYPGGADYICGFCEDGANTLYRTDCWHLQFIETGTGKVMYYHTYYNEEELTKAVRTLDEIINGPNSTGAVDMDVVTDDYWYWDR